MTRVPGSFSQIRCLALECVEAVCIQDDWEFVFPHDAAHELRRFWMARNTRADRQHGLSLNQSVHFPLLQCAYRNATGIGFVQGLSHQFGMEACHRRQN